MKEGIPAKLPPLVALVGDDEQRKERLLEELLARAGRDAAVISWPVDAPDKPEVELSRLLCDMRSRPLFGGAKLIVARDGDGLLKRIGHGLAPVLERDLGNRLVLLVRTIDGRTVLARGIKAAGGWFACERPRVQSDGQRTQASPELLQAIQDEAARQGVQLNADAARELAGRTGNDMLLVQSELGKLLSYCGGGARVALKDVEAVVPRSAAWDQFRVFDEVARGDAAAALRRVRGMLESGTRDKDSGRRTTEAGSIAMLVLYALMKRVRLVARYRELKHAGLGQDALCEQLGVRNPGQLFYLGKEAALPLMARAQDALNALLEANRDLLSSAPAELVLERLVVRLASLARPRAATVRR